MTNTDTNDTEATVAQTIALADAGCELVRITAQGEREARNLANIKESLRIKGYSVPLIADIHFNPKAAEIAATLVEKVRINPGNYIDRNTAGKFSFTNAEYALELEKIAERIYPLLQICRDHGTAIRIGSNHGSLSSRIMSRYGDTPAGMAESALEFARICKEAGFHNLVLSMKSSNVRVMVHATRLLVHQMMQEGMDYPIHLGVTEAGDGEDGIIKSAAGIGTLLEDGIGDTIRVSLTGDPLKEIPVAREIVKRYKGQESSPEQHLPYTGYSKGSGSQQPSPFEFHKRTSIAVGMVGGDHPFQVLQSTENGPELLNEAGEPVAKLTEEEYNTLIPLTGTVREMRNTVKNLSKADTRPILLKCSFANRADFASYIYQKDPVKLLPFQVHAAIEIGSMLIDGIGNAVLLDSPGIDLSLRHQTAFAILQATRTRITRTEFISCPSCGRTLFDIEDTLSKVKAATSHLKGLKIAVMGCIVNGPGEMADADYGYVGAGKGQVTLYKSREVVKRGIPESEAIGELISLIKTSGSWVDPV